MLSENTRVHYCSCTMAAIEWWVGKKIWSSNWTAGIILVFAAYLGKPSGSLGILEQLAGKILGPNSVPSLKDPLPLILSIGNLMLESVILSFISTFVSLKASILPGLLKLLRVLFCLFI